ncbi:MAG: hypothetical protein M1832_005827 [Thelocarpon impressellum]|nr:MAG: hypothetical protein M1832_005827 [Thelocarpon impressellum]
MPIPDASASKAFSGPPPVPVPRALPAYLSQAGAEPVKLDVPQPLLLVLDLNGTLLFRPSRASPTSFRARPDLEAFVAYIMSSYSVMVWSSAKPQNVARMCDKIFSRQQRQCVVAEWGRDRLGLSAAQYNAKLQVYKQLEKVWRDAAIAAAHPCYGAGARWDQSNTVLIDDSLLKAASQPHNILPVPEYVGKPENGARPLREAVAYLEELSWYGDVSAFMRARPFAVGADWAGQAYVDGFDE